MGRKLIEWFKSHFVINNHLIDRLKEGLTVVKQSKKFDYSGSDK